MHQFLDSLYFKFNFGINFSIVCTGFLPAKLKVVITNNKAVAATTLTKMPIFGRAN